MSGQSGSEVTQDDKLWVVLGYIIPLIAIVVLLMEDKKKRPFIKYHAVHSIVLWVIISVIYIVASIITFGILACILWLLYLILLWPIIDSLSGKYTVIPVVTDFIKGQKWV
jgi:uncharacterized membrane protein